MVGVAGSRRKGLEGLEDLEGRALEDLEGGGLEGLEGRDLEGLERKI